MQKKTEIVTVRMTPKVKEQLRQRAQDANMTLTDYLCICGLGKEIIRVDSLDDVLSELKAQGRNLNQLTTLANMGKLKILRSRGVLNPQAYFNQNNPDFYKNSDYWRKPYDWHATSIRVILNNPVYLGKLVYGRSKTKATVYKGLQAV